MKILMLNPPFLPKYSRFSRSPAVTKSNTLYYPIWHAYATGVLEKEGHDVRLIDAPAEGIGREECFRRAKEYKPEMVVVYTSTPSIYNDIEIGGLLKELLPEAFVVLTGPHVSALPEDSLELDFRIDCVARHEYDLTLLELAQSLKNGGDLAKIKGITFRNQKGYTTTEDREFIKDMDSLPFVSAVYKKHLKIENYFYAHCRYPVVSIFSSRGCYGRCNFCVYPQQMFGRQHRQRSPENIVDEFEYIQRELPQVKEVLIDDDTFSFNENHTIEFCEKMIERKIKIPWTVECRASLKYQTMVLMKKAGCRLIVIGFESADEKILKNINKGITLTRMREFVRDAKKAKVMIHSCFIVGNMGENRQTLRRSLAFAKEINADTCQFYPLMVYPGTEAYAWAESNGYLTTSDYKRWLTEDGLHNCVVSTPELSSMDLVRFCSYARRSFYMAPRYLGYKLWQVIRKPGEIRKTAIAARKFFRYLYKA